jgi:hypothetical protein
MNSILFDSTELRNTTYIPRYVKHESATERELNILNLARDNGGVLVNDRRGIKVITLQGILTASTQALLETAIDNFKELFSRTAKNLDIEWAGSTRRYVATCKSHNFDRDYFHLLFVPWTAEMVVVSGFGEDTSETTVVNADTFIANYKTKAITLAGSADPKIRFSIAIDSPNNTIKGVELKNTDTGERVYATSFTSLEAKTVEIDTKLKTFKVAGVEVPYYGVFPKFIIGTNNIQISLGDIIDQQFAPTTVNSNYSIHSSLKVSQGFRISYSDSTYTSIWLELSYTGNPSVACKVRIETDNAGEPSGTLADANSYGTISKGEMAGTTTRTWYQVFFNAQFVLQSNTQYWIVLEPYAGGLDVSNNFKWYYEAGINATYKFGNAGLYDAGWTQYPDSDMKFKLCFGGTMDYAGATQTYSIYQTKLYL